jgi:hypothetical protein
MRNGRITLFTAAVLVLAALSSPAPAASGTWIGTASGNWSDVNNWTGGIVADGAQFTANLSTVDLTGNITVTIDGAVASRTLAILNIGDTNTTNSYMLAGNGGATLTLDNYGLAAQLNQTATSKGDTLDATLPVRLASNLDVSNAGANALTVNGGISAIYAGAKIITNKGAGTGAVTLGGNITDGTGRVYIPRTAPPRSWSCPAPTHTPAGRTSRPASCGLPGRPFRPTPGSSSAAPPPAACWRPAARSPGISAIPIARCSGPVPAASPRSAAT